MMIKQANNYSVLWRGRSASLAALLLIAAGGGAQAAGPDHPQAEHVDQAELYNLVVAGQHKKAFEEAFELGDELFETLFNHLDGVGAHVGQKFFFTRVPRADLNGPGEWATHVPARHTGPNARACNECHQQPFDDGAGSGALNTHRDPTHSGDMKRFIQRNTPHLFGIGALQRLAEEMTERLHKTRGKLIARVCRKGGSQQAYLSAKGVSFGSIKVTQTSAYPCKVDIDTSAVKGVDKDLVIKPLQWKGSDATVRIFNRGAGHNELGMQAVELAGDDIDGDGDGVTNELTVGDMTAMTIYVAAQPRPVTKLELDKLGLLTPALTRAEKQAIRKGEHLFKNIGCGECHKPKMKIYNPVFSEPSQSPAYQEETFPAGQSTVARLVDPYYAVQFDLTKDLPDNIIEGPNGETVHLGNFERNRKGYAIVRLYGDLKRHDMGSELAESIDEVGTGAAMWLTKELWGVGSTAPYLHDGRASTLTEAILAHGGDAEDVRNRFEALSLDQQEQVIAFLNNLILFKLEEEEEE